MTIFAPLFNAELAVQLHVLGVALAVALLPLTLWRRRRDRIHRVAGYAWVLGMALAALSSFFISGFALIGPFGPIHVISVYVLIGLVLAVRAALQRRIAAHEAHMRGLAFGGIGVAGLLSFMPGRMMNQLVFEGHEMRGFVALCLIFAISVLRAQARRRIARGL